MGKASISGLLAGIRSIRERCRKPGRDESARRTGAVKKFNEPFAETWLRSTRAALMGRRGLTRRLRRVEEDIAAAEADARIDYGGDFLADGEDPTYFYRQAKRRRRAAREARKLARRQGMSKSRAKSGRALVALVRLLRRRCRK